MILAAIADFASSLCKAPIALVRILDRERQWFLAKTGLEELETTRRSQRRPILAARCALQCDEHLPTGLIAIHLGLSRRNRIIVDYEGGSRGARRLADT